MTPVDTADRTHFSWRDRAALAALTLAGTALRLALAWDRPRLGDEVGTLLSLRMDAGYLLTHFSGWLTMNYFILAEKGVARLAGSEGWPLEILPLLGGVAVIPSTASLARRLGGVRLALIAAALTAFQPYLVRFSPVLRAYAPLAAAAVWSVDLFFRWRERRTWASGMAAAAVVLLMLLVHPNGIYVVAGLGALVGIEVVGELRRSGIRRAYLMELTTLLVPLAAAGAASWLAYRPLAADVRTFTVQWSAAPPTSLEYVPGVFATYFGSGFLLFVPGALLLAGVWSATQARKTLLPLCLLAGLSPILVSLKGVSHFPWAYARFQIYCVPLLLILMAEGIRWLSEQATPARIRGGAAAVLTAVAVLAWVPPMAKLFTGKRENAVYAQTAAYLLKQRAPGDVIVIAGAPHLQLTPLLPQGADGPIKAEEFVKKPDALPDAKRVLFVAADDPPLGEPETRRRFGGLQVVAYAGPGPAACASLRADLARNVANEPTAPAFGDTYQLLAQLDKGQPAARAWRFLARLCRTQTARFRSLPEQMRVRDEVRANGGVPAVKPAAREEPEAEN